MDNVREIMEWYVEAGVDILLEDHPVDRFSETPPPPRHSSKQPSGQSPAERLAKREENSPRPAQTERHPATIPDATAVNLARELATAANSLEELKAAMAGFDGCNLKRTAKSLVFCDGKPDAKVMLIGEAPDRDEDIQGQPFVGRSGQLLDKMLAAINLDRESTYLTTVIPWRPPGNRTPTPQELEICRPFIERQIELVKPEIVLIMGGLSTKTLVSSNDGIMKLRGQWTEIEINNTTINALPTLHPGYLLKQPAHKRLAWQDLLSLKQKLDT